MPGCAGGTCLNARCDRVDCSTGRVWAPAEDGAFGICVPQPCPSPSPTPVPTPIPSVPPGPGVKCAPLDRVGVVLHSTQERPHAPRGIRWVFSSTPKSAKPFCPESRNECEQQAYEGNPVTDYSSVVWRFDLRFQCQDQRGPLWAQWEPQTGASPQPVDVQHLNAYNANLVPAVAGRHRVRTCPQGTPDFNGPALPAGCSEAMATAP